LQDPDYHLLFYNFTIYLPHGARTKFFWAQGAMGNGRMLPMLLIDSWRLAAWATKGRCPWHTIIVMYSPGGSGEGAENKRIEIQPLKFFRDFFGCRRFRQYETVA
jgi:hypothetical protein